jgi:hypothetical protein
MNKEEVIKALEDAKVDVSLTQEGEIRADLLELALEGVNASRAKEAYEQTIATLNERIEELEKQKTPVEKANLILRKKNKKEYRMKLPVVNFKNQKVTAEALNNDQNLLEELLATKTSLLVEEGKED